MIAGILALSLITYQQGTITLQDAKRMAVEHSTEVRIARNALKSAWARAGVVAAKTHPQLGISASAERFDDRTTVDFGGASLEMLGDHTEEASLQLVQLVDVSNLIGTAHAQARFAALAEEYALKSRISDQILNTETTYMNVLRADQGAHVAQASLDAYRGQLTLATALWKQGAGQRIDVYRATSQVAEAEKALVQRQNDLSMARSVLNDQLGIPLAFETKLTDAADQDGEAQLLPDGQIESLTAAALIQRSEAKSAALATLAAQKGIRVARSSTDPTVALAVAGSYFPTTSFTYPRQSLGVVTLTVSIPIFDGGEARARADDAKAALDSAKAQEQQVQRAISLQVQNAFLGVTAARKSLQAAESALKAAVAARDLAGQRFENQVGLYLEVTDAQAALSAAQAGRVNAIYDLLIARVHLERAIGDLVLPTQEKSKS